MINIGQKIASVCCVAIWLAGCGGDSDPPLTASQKCDELSGAQIAAAAISLPTKGATISKASVVEKSPGAGEYCNVEGQINSLDAAAEPIKFRVALPTDWNKRMLQLGGGGWNGAVPDVVNGAAYLSQGRSPLARGYVVFGSDSGHSVKPGVNAAAFTLNGEMLRNFTGEQLKKTRDTVVEIIKRRYGYVAEKTYFMGGSEGGRESMVAIQRYPADYDGVYTLFPAFNWTAHFMKFNAVGSAMRSNGGAGWINPAKEVLLRTAATSACDSKDGLVDGVISNVEACTFDPAVLRCPDGSDTGNTCLSDAQIVTTKVMFSKLSWPYALSNNVQSIGPFLPGTDFSSLMVLGTTASFDLDSILAGRGPATIGALHDFGDSFIRYAVMQDPHADTLKFDPANPGVYLARLQEMSRLFDATSQDISAFMARGGKWIMAHGDADQLVHIVETNKYYENLVSAYGQAKIDNTLRYYRIPGYAHLQGPFQADGGVPALDALEAWVERGQAPGTLAVTDTAAGHNLRTRPLCIYPAWPRYKGSGDPANAASFDCVK